VLTGGVLEVDPARMRWQPSAAGPVALSVPDDIIASDTAASRDGADLANALAAGVLAGPVRALVQASRPFGVSEQVLWGNVASVVSGAVALIGAARPELTGRAQVIATGLLDRPPLQGTHQRGGGGFRRRSCCLVYRVAPGDAPVCGDCVLDRAPLPARRSSAGR
jgi:ferric iron reductase protein FhuF